VCFSNGDAKTTGPSATLTLSTPIISWLSASNDLSCTLRSLINDAVESS